jgi:hypothetical protein
MVWNILDHHRMLLPTREKGEKVPMKRTMILWGVLLVLVLLAGCGSTASSSPSATSTAGARATACQTMTNIDQHLTSLSQVGEQTTVGEAKTLQRRVAASITVVDKLISGELGPRLSNLQAANNQLGTTLANYPDTVTIGQISTKLQGFKDQVSKAQAAAADLSSGLKCP